MFSAASEWRDGSLAWHAEHDSSRGIYDLRQQGDLPPEFHSVSGELRAEQDAAGGKSAGVDYIFDAPISLAHALTGFRHDIDVPGLGDDPFEVLICTNPPHNRKGWIERLFGA